MKDAAIGRVLLASLHQGIADVLPMRLGFYEEWLNAKGLRDGSIGLGPVSAVLSFLRQEGEPYDVIMTRAGTYAAEWTVETMSPFHRRIVHAMPMWLRARWLLRLTRRLVHDTCQTSHAVSRIRRGVARVDVRGSLFCSVREPVGRPLCRFYVSAFTRLLEQFDLTPQVIVVECRGTGHEQCVLTIALTPDLTSREPEARAA